MPSVSFQHQSILSWWSKLMPSAPHIHQPSLTCFLLPMDSSPKPLLILSSSLCHPASQQCLPSPCLPLLVFQELGGVTGVHQQTQFHLLYS